MTASCIGEMVDHHLGCELHYVVGRPERSSGSLCEITWHCMAGYCGAAIVGHQPEDMTHERVAAIARAGHASRHGVPAEYRPETHRKPSRYAGAAWLRSCGKELSPFGERVADLLGWWAYGLYHISDDAWRADWTGERHIALTLRCSGWATFDGGQLTRLVIGAHDRAIRVELEPVAPRYVRLVFYQRGREGRMYERHPTMERALADCSDREGDGAHFLASGVCRYRQPVLVDGDGERP